MSAFELLKEKLSAMTRQREIYVRGLAGIKPLVPIDFNNLEKLAKAKMSKEAYAYIAGGAGLEGTMSNNRSSLNKYRIVPRMLKDVSKRDTSINLFGRELASPFLMCPIGVLEMVHKEADLAVGKAAAELNVPMIFSNQASVPMEKVAGAMGNSPKWFQLYWSKSNELVASLVSRAEKCGCEAIVVTLDTTLLGWRTRDLDLGFLPFLHGKGIAQYTSDPVFNSLLKDFESDPENDKHRVINLNTIKAALGLMKRVPGPAKESLKKVQQFTSIYSRPSLTWDDLVFLRKHTKLPILLKGILHEDDAKLALDHGIDGIIVSNHGGRQVDGSISSFEALPKVVKAINGKIPVLLDSGIRGGADAFKAIALGASAVCIGRPYVYGLTIKGQKGVEAVLKHFIADFELTMGLAGCKSIVEVNSDCIIKN